MSRTSAAGRRAGLFGAAAGVVAAGAAAGFALERYAMERAFRARGIDQPPEAYGSIRGKVQVIRADDGTPLHVEVHESAKSKVTVVFCHGWALTQDCWHYQRRDLGDVGRLVFWDQRGHGLSGRGEKDQANIEQLGRDLQTVLQAVVPKGPIVLVGHSMGGMTIMALAEQRPELFGDRVLGVALLGTSSGKLADVTLGIPWLAGKLLGRMRPRVFNAVSRKADLVERGIKAGSDLAYVMTRKFAFGSDVSPELIRFVQRELESTPMDVIADFYPALHSHDKLAVLPVLAKVETLVMVGAGDLLCPADHSRAIAGAVPGSELVVIPDGGHLVFLEHPDVVNHQLREMCRRALARNNRLRRAGPAA